MSYIQKKSRLFKAPGRNGTELVPKRSEGRLKTYPSATDARAWCDENEDRRQYILELIRRGGGKGLALGRYVPIEVIIDTLLANKNDEIERLKKKIDELQKLLDSYSELGLTEDQKKKVKKTKGDMDQVGEELGTMSQGEKSLKDKEREKAEAEARAKKAAEEREKAAAEREKAEREKAEREKAEAEKADAEKADADALAKEKAEKEAAERAKREEEEAARRAQAEKDAAAAAAAKQKSGAADQKSPEELAEMLINKDAEIIALKNALAAKEAYCEEQHKLAVAAIEQLENIKGIIEERDDLRRKLKRSQEELETLKKQGSGKFYSSLAGSFGTCQEEIANLEREIEVMRSGNLSPEQEAEVIRKEVEVLKKYCAKLSSIQEENQQLKKEREGLRQQMDQLGSTEAVPQTNDADELKNQIRELQGKLKLLDGVKEERDKLQARVQQLEQELMKYGDLPEAVEVYKRRSQMLDGVMQEKENLARRLKELEGLDEETEELKRRADRVLELERMLEQMRRSSNAEILGMKSNCSEIRQELEGVLAERDLLQAKLNSMLEELEAMKDKARAADILKMDRDRLQMRLNELEAMEADYNKMLNRMNCLENIKNERNMYKAKYEELLGIEAEVDVLRAQLERAKAIEAEKNRLQRQVEDLQAYIEDQEEEIKKLVAHVDELAHGRDEQQCLSFDELHELHTKTCNATASLLQRSGRAIGGVGPQPEDKLSLMRRVATLENELIRKQKHAQQKVAALQVNVKLEKQRLEELRRTLEIEKQKNSDLQSKIGMHTKAVVNMQVERDLMQRQNSHHEERLQKFMYTMNEEKNRAEQLREDLERERQQNQQLLNQLTKAKESKKRDNEALRSMKLILEKSLSSEMKLRMQLEERERGIPQKGPAQKGSPPRGTSHKGQPFIKTNKCACKMHDNMAPNRDMSIIPTDNPKKRSSGSYNEYSMPSKQYDRHTRSGRRNGGRSQSEERSGSAADTLDIDDT